jgi:hypothetical protein
MKWAKFSLPIGVTVNASLVLGCACIATLKQWHPSAALFWVSAPSLV